MKKQLLLLLAVFGLAFAKAQVSIQPSTATQTDTATLIFDATGTELENETGTLYAYTGVTINGNRWENIIVPSFSENNGAPQWTNTGGNIYELTIGTSIESFYNVAAGDVVSEICLVVRNATATAQTRPDIFIPVFAPGLNAVMTSPQDGAIFNAGQSVTVSGDASRSANLDLSVNNTSISTATAATISTSYTFPTSGAYELKITATDGGSTVEDAISVYVPGATQNQAQPNNLKNGVNENADGSVTFLLTAPLKDDVMLIGSFNDWDLDPSYQMNKDGNDFWITVPATEFTANTDFMYQYLVDFDIKIADPFSHLILDPGSDQFIKPGNYPDLPTYPADETTGDVTLYTYQKTPYAWTTNNFVRPDKENLVIYEILPRDFSEEDSYQSIIDRIDYLDDLGINALQFMPLNEFEGTDSWGYNPKLHGALDKAYGTPEKLKELIDLCHSRGIAVILDIVYNHAFSQSPLNQMWWDSSNNRPATNNPYLNPVARHPFNVGDDFNHESEFTKEYVKQTMAYFIEEYRFDGFRFDLSKGFSQRSALNNQGLWDSYDQNRVDVLNEYKNHIWNNPSFSNEIYMILEHLGTAGEETQLANDGFMLWGKMTDQFNQNSMGYGTDNNVFRSYFTSRNFNDQHLVAYAESHDEERLMVKNLDFGNTANGSHNVTDLSVALARQEAIAAILYSIPGPKMLWQFGEIGYDISINASASNLNCTTCRTDRKPIPWTLNYDSNQDRMDLYEATAAMIRLKTDYPETFNNTNNNLSLAGLQKRINLYGPNFDAVVVANFDVFPRTVVPNFSRTGTWYDFVNNNNGLAITSSNQNTPLSLQPGEYRVYTSTPLAMPLSNNDFTAVDNPTITLFPNPATTAFALSENVESVVIYNVSGQEVLSFNTTLETYDVSSLESGIYFVKASTGGQVTNLKLMVK
jgi:1,4-alpha-glucan branching enzyme